MKMVKSPSKDSFINFDFDANSALDNERLCIKMKIENRDA